jgi:beta-glucosidase/6-phospho-beta-glucosidase/beta-galactosidase
MLWGVATSGHQVEGNSTDDWSIFESDPSIRHKVRTNAAAGGVVMNTAPAGPALRHHNLDELRRDLDRAAALGCTAYRFSVEWSRVEPSRGTFSSELADYYVPVVRELRLRGLEPFVTLNHLTLPQWALTPSRTHLDFNIFGQQFVETYDSDPGFQASLRGWENPVLISAFATYCDAVVKALAPAGVKWWMTLNEPVGSMIGAGYFGSVWSPGFLGDYARGKTAYLNLLRAHLTAFQVIKGLDPSAQVGFAHNMMSVVPLGDDPDPARRFDYFYHRHILDSLNTGVVDVEIDADPGAQDRQPPGTFFGSGAVPWRRAFDFIGVNYYFRARVYWDAFIGLKGGRYSGGRFDPDQSAHGITHASTGKLTGLGWELHPDGLREILLELKNRYNAPLVVTEFGMSESREALRGPHLVAHASAIEAARAAGADVRAAFYWTLSDNWELTYHYEPRGRFGLFTVDRTPGPGGLPLTRSMTDAALALRSLAVGAVSLAVEVRHGALSSDGGTLIPPVRSPGALYRTSVGGFQYLLWLARSGRATRDLDALVYSFGGARWSSATVHRWDANTRQLTLTTQVADYLKPTDWRLELAADLLAGSGEVDNGPAITVQRVIWDGLFSGDGWLARLRLVPTEEPAAEPIVAMRLLPPNGDWINADTVQVNSIGQLTGTLGGAPLTGTVIATPVAGAEPDVRLSLTVRFAATTSTLSLIRLSDDVAACPGIDPVTTEPGAPLCVTSPAADELHVLAADTTGRILGCHWTPATAWTTWAPVQAGVTGPAGWVSAASRRPGQLDLITAGADGRIYTAARDPAGQWAGWWVLPGIRTHPGAPVCITSPAPDELHVLAADTTGRILGCHWTPTTTWTEWAAFGQPA